MRTPLRLLQFFCSLLLLLRPDLAAAQTPVPFGTVYVHVSLDTRVAPDFPARLRALTAQLQIAGVPFLSVILDATSLRVVFRPAAGLTTLEELTTFTEAVRQSGLAFLVQPVIATDVPVGTLYTSLSEVSDDLLRGVVPVSQALIDPTSTLGPHASGVIRVSPTTFALATPNRATATAELTAAAAAAGVTLRVEDATGQLAYRGTFDPNRIGSLEVLRRLRAPGWAQVALEYSILPAAVFPPLTRYWVLSGQARPGGPFEQFVVQTNDSLGGIGHTLEMYLQSQAYVPLRVRIAPRGAGDHPVAGLERYALPWVVRDILGIGLADFGRSDLQGRENTPPFTAAPSDISPDPAGWIAAHGDILWTQKFKVVAQVVPSSESALGNISARAQVGRGERVVIGGFQVKGGSTRTLILRAMGPSLAAHRIANPLANPRLRVYRGGDLVAENDDWQAAPRAAELQARFPQFAPADPREPALLATFYPGVHTVIVSGAADEEGVAVYELFDAPEQP
ncbi:MAG: hypothetical protein JSR82_03555 [Verrucomicrobia bacterium]|nr:hypothetical protein [Verrucomicrobiota bacterium]